MTARFTHPLAPFFYEHSNLFPLYFAINDGRHRGTRDMWRATYKRTVVARNEQNVVERDRFTNWLRSAVDGDNSPWFDSHLSPTTVDNRVHQLSFLNPPSGAHRLRYA